MLRSEDSDRVRVLTLDRPEALNAFNEALYDALTDALAAALDDPAVAVVVLTGEGRAFCAGTDLLEMAQRTTDPAFVPGRHGFPGLIDGLVAFEKPLVLAINASLSEVRPRATDAVVLKVMIAPWSAGFSDSMSVRSFGSSAEIFGGRTWHSRMSATKLDFRS